MCQEAYCNTISTQAVITIYNFTGRQKTNHQSMKGLKSFFSETSRNTAWTISLALWLEHDQGVPLGDL